MSFSLGLEAMNYTTNSEFSKDLISMFEEVIDYRKKVKETAMSLTKVVTEVERFFLKVTAPKLFTAIRKHTGVPLGKLYVSKSFSAMFACTVDIGGDKGQNMYTTIQRYCGIELDEYEKEYVQKHSKHRQLYDDELEKLAASFDKRTGKMAINKIAGKDIKFILFFDYNAAFLAQETGHVNLPYLEADEITAIVLHEIGHMMTMFEHAAEAYFKAVFRNNNILNLVKSGNKFEVIDEGLKYLSKRFPTKKDMFDALSAKIESDRKAYSATGGMSTFGSLLYVAVVTIFSLIAGVVALPFRVLFNMVEPMLETLESNQKLSDYAVLRKQYKYCEQLADEFVSRHGLSGKLASGLGKLFTWCEVTGLGMINRNSSLAWAAAKIPFILTTMFYGDVTDGGGDYDRGYDRVTRAMMHLIDVFKNSDMPKEAIEFYLQDYEHCREVVNSYNKNRKLVEIMNVLGGMINYLLRTPVELMFTGRFLSEYNKLHNKAETLVANVMFYHATKLKQLSSKIKK